MKVGDLNRLCGIVVLAIVLSGCDYRRVYISPDVNDATLTFSPTTIVANGSDAATATFTVSLKEGAPSGFVVQIAADSNIAVLQSAPATDSKGVVTALLTSRQPGTWPVSAYVQLGGQTLLVTAPTPLTVLPVAVAPITVSLVTSGVPTSVVAGQTFTFSVRAEDANGALVSGFADTVQVGSDDGGLSLRTLYAFKQTDGGSHTFSWTLTTAGSRTLEALDVSSGATTSAGIQVVPANATGLSFMGMPSSVPICTPISPPVQVALVDPYGNTATSSSAQVSLAFSANPNGASLSGSTVQATTLGIATFSALSLNQVGLGYGFAASSSGLAGATSSAFDVVAAPPTVAIGSPAGASGVIIVPYSVADACGYPALITVEYSADGNTFAPATQAASSNANGVYDVETSFVGQPLQYAWDSSKDLADSNTTTAAIRIIAMTRNGSNTATQRGLHVNNSVQLNPSAPLSAATGSCVAVADPNHDAKPDLLVCNPNTAAVLSGDGNFSFSASATLPAPSSAAIATGDIDHNGHDDFVVANANGVVVYTSGASGTTWTAVATVPLAAQRVVRLADVSHDGNLDLLTGGDGSFTYGLGRGDGTFNPPMTSTRGSVWGLAVADFNKDGNSEIVIADNTGGAGATGQVAILALNHGATAFSSWFTFTTAAPSDVDVGDFNRDGNQDIAIANLNGGFTIALGSGGAAFNLSTGNACATRCVRARIADVDGDGKSDVVTASTTNVVVINQGDGAGNFSPLYTAALAGQPTDIALRDVNLDNKVDIAVATLNGTIVLENQRVSRTWDAGGAQSYYIDAGLLGTTIGDFNHDGKPDVAVSSNGNNRVDVLVNDGAGGLSLRQRLPVAQPQLPTSADLNGDTYMDLVVPSKSGNSILVFLNKSGLFQNSNSYPVGTSPSQVAIADLNHDGNLDAIVANAGTAQLSVLLGQGNGIFAAATPYPVPSATTAVDVGDFNHDALVDAAAASQNSNRLFVLLNMNVVTNILGAAQPLGTDAIPQSVAVGDFNKDGYADLATAAFNANTIDVFMNNTNNTFAGPMPLTTYNGGPKMVVAGNFNGDASLDLLSVAQNTNTLYVYTGRGDGTFNVAGNANYATDLAPVALSVGDLTGDGLIDVVVTNALDPGAQQQSISVLRSTSTGFVDLARSVATTSDEILWGAFADVNLDGIMDGVFVSLENNGYTSIRLGDGRGAFAATGGSDFSLPAGQFAAVVDINLDAWPDILLGAGGNPAVQVLLNHQGVFATGTSVPIGSGGSASLVGLATPDMDHNGAPDLVVIDYYKTLSVALGNGDGTFAAKVSYPCGTSPISVDVGDIDNNGLPDVMVAYSGQIGIFLGQPGGALGTCTTVPVTNLYQAFLSDLNNDGWLDIGAINNDAVNTVRVFLNANGAFGTSTSYGVQGVAVTGTQVFGLPGDVDGDGRMDVVVGSWLETNGFAVLRGDGRGNLLPPVYFVAFQDSTNVHVTDLDRNGLPDVVAPSQVVGFKGVGILLGR